MDLRLGEYYATQYRIDLESGDCVYIVKSKHDFLPPCSNCGSGFVYGHGSYHRQIRDLSICGNHVELDVECSKFKCLDCGCVFQTELPFAKKGSKVTNRFRQHIIEQVQLIHNFRTVAKLNRISDTTVGKMYKEYVQQQIDAHPVIAPVVLGIDEAHILPRQDGNKAYAVFTDLENKILLDILDNRSKGTVKDFLRSMAAPENLQAVVIDMWRHYRTAVYEWNEERKTQNPTARDVVLVIDRFHVIQELCRKSLAEWKSEVEHIPGYKPAHTSKLLTTNDSELTEEEQFRLREVLYQSPRFDKIRALKREFQYIYSSHTRQEAEEAYKVWRDKIPTDFEHLSEFVSTVDNWKTEIFNYFDYRYTNGYTEAINGRIKQIHRLGRGYNYEVLRMKVLFELGKNLPPHYANPVAFNSDGKDYHMAFVDSMKTITLPGITDTAIKPRGVNLDTLVSAWQEEKSGSKMSLSGSQKYREWITVTDEAYHQGYIKGETKGYDEGLEEGYQIGYNAGYDDATSK